MRTSRAQGLLVAGLAWAVLAAGCLADDGDGDGQGAGEGDEGPAAESGILSGTLTATESLFDGTLPLKAEHGRLAAMLVLVSNLPQTSIGLNVSGPDGRSDEVRTSPTLYALPGGRPSMSFAEPGAVEWHAVVELRSGASADFEVHWCADDEDAPGPQDNLACHRDFS